MIISHDRKALFIGVPKNGSQTARAVLGQFGVDLVGEMGRHPTVAEAIRLAEARFPGEAITPTNIYAFWRDPVERFCSAVEFHKRSLPNSFIELFPDRFIGIPPHSKWFEPHPELVAKELKTIIEGIPPADIIAALPPLSVSGAMFQPRAGNLSFYQPQEIWLRHAGIARLAFERFEHNLQLVATAFGSESRVDSIPKINCRPREPV